MTNFDDIPQEKWDNFENMTKSKKQLKIEYIDIQNFKNIESISTSVADWNVIGGFNGEGKSSFTESILTAIQGNKFYGKGKVGASDLVNNSATKSTIKILIKGKEEELIIERIFTKKNTSKLEATLNGKKIKQSDLDELLNALTIDPIKLSQLTSSEQLNIIKETIGLDTTEIDEEIEEAKSEYSETNSFQKQAKAVYDDFTLGGIPNKVEKQSLTELLTKRDIFDERNNKVSEYNRKKDEISDIESQIEKLQESLKNKKDELDNIKTEGKQINEKIKEQGLTTVEDLNEQISSIEENNEQAEKYSKYEEYKKNVLSTEEDFEKAKNKLNDLRDKRKKVLSESGLPDYMTINDDGIFIDGVSYHLINTAKKIEVAIDLILLSGSPLRMIRIENGGEIDTKTLESVKTKIIDNNFQIFIERPILDKYDTIVINDGEIVENNN